MLPPHHPGAAHARRHWRRWALAAAGLAAVGAYYRFRPCRWPINGPPTRSYRVPSGHIRFLHNTSWYEDGRRQSRLQIAQTALGVIREARRFVLLDVFLFNRFGNGYGDYLPLTRRIADAFAAKRHPRYFITDPFNTSYGTHRSVPLMWLRDGGTRVCVTNLRHTRDNNLLYSPLWRLSLQWFDNGRRVWLQHPLVPDLRTTVRAALEGLNLKGNHRKLLIADSGDSYVTLVTSSNFEDSSCYYTDSALLIRSQAVARHFLEAERAVAAMSGCAVAESIPPAPEETGDAWVTPLMGAAIERATLADIDGAGPGDRIFLLMLFLASRPVIEALVSAAHRGVRVTVLLDRSRRSFGNVKHGFPNQMVACELARRAPLELRWSNTEQEELHSKLLVIEQPHRCVIQTGSANFTRRGLSNTVLEASVRVACTPDSELAREALAYCRWMAAEPRTLPFDGGDPSRLKYGWYRFQEATGASTF
jgi:phosphatidylserine/phosphatidylglycerophosphate/cardiolipin synthase-like enzyme